MLIEYVTPELSSKVDILFWVVSVECNYSYLIWVLTIDSIYISCGQQMCNIKAVLFAYYCLKFPLSIDGLYYLCDIFRVYYALKNVCLRFTMPILFSTAWLSHDDCILHSLFNLNNSLQHFESNNGVSYTTCQVRKHFKEN